MVTSQCTVGYAVDMTTKGQPGRVVRIDDETWADYEKACDEKGVARATDIRMYVLREVAAWRKAHGIETPKKRVVRVKRRKPAESDD
jgi:hypothetical protein